mgnify:CR=1 FL=1
MTQYENSAADDHMSSGSEYTNNDDKSLKGVASQVTHSAQKIVKQVADKSDGALAWIGEGISAVGGTIKRNVGEKGSLGSTATAVAERLEEGGRYLQSHGIEAVTHDLTTVIRRIPVSALWVGLGAGLLIGATLARK